MLRTEVLDHTVEGGFDVVSDVIVFVQGSPAGDVWRRSGANQGAVGVNQELLSDDVGLREREVELGHDVGVFVEGENEGEVRSVADVGGAVGANAVFRSFPQPAVPGRHVVEVPKVGVDSLVLLGLGGVVAVGASKDVVGHDL